MEGEKLCLLERRTGLILLVVMMHSENHVLPQTYVPFIDFGTGFDESYLYQCNASNVSLSKKGKKKSAAQQMTVWIIGLLNVSSILCSSQIRKICH
jgi:hypothetical protein